MQRPYRTVFVPKVSAGNDSGVHVHVTTKQQRSRRTHRGCARISHRSEGSTNHGLPSGCRIPHEITTLNLTPTSSITATEVHQIWCPREAGENVSVARQEATSRASRTWGRRGTKAPSRFLPLSCCSAGGAFKSTTSASSTLCPRVPRRALDLFSRGCVKNSSKAWWYLGWSLTPLVSKLEMHVSG